MHTDIASTIGGMVIPHKASNVITNIAGDQRIIDETASITIFLNTSYSFFLFPSVGGGATGDFVMMCAAPLRLVLDRTR